MKRLLLSGLFLLVHGQVFAHAEHDKARYVAPNGVDQGHCENYATPCKTIGYASSRANKGDKVLVAEGQYAIKDLDELFYLTSELVPTYGGYSEQDHYQQADPKNHPTYLNGVPLEYKAQLVERGFAVVTDTKAYSKSTEDALAAKLANYKMLGESQKNQACVNGDAQGFPCNNVDLVSHVPLSGFSSNPSAANDIWGHVDLNTGTEYAIIGLRNGTAVVSLADPENPTVVGVVPGLSAVWRDIKVYQYFDASFGAWRAYAYVSTDGAADKITVIDLSGLPNSIENLGKTSDDSSLHNIYISNVSYTTGVAINGRTPRLHAMGSSQFGGAHRSYSLVNPESLAAEYRPTDATRSDYTHDGASFVVTDDRVANNCQRDGDECDVFLDFNENEMRLWDQTDGDQVSELGQSSYADANYTHSGWWTEDKQYVYVHDELDEQNDQNTIDRTNVIIFNVTDLNNPEYVGRWEGPTAAIDHNGFVRGNRYYMSNYERGLTILDITDPETPSEIGYFDTFPVSDNDQFNGAWGVYPFLPSGLILVSDINSGLYVLRDNTKTVSQGTLEFDDRSISAAEGDSVTITVNRINGSSGAITVEYQTLTGSTDSADFVSQTGILSWAANDTSAKTITVEVNNDVLDDELTEQFSVELFNPQGGATLSSPGAAWVSILGASAQSAVEFGADSAQVIELIDTTNGSTEVQVPVRRFPPFDQQVSVSVQVVASSNYDSATLGQDFELTETTVSWTAGDTEDKTFSVTVFDDETSENTEEILLNLVHGEDTRATSNQSFSILIRDNESNMAPTVTSEDYSAVTIRNFDLKNQVNINDDDADLSYLWTQESGPALTINDANSLNAFISTNQAGEYVIKLVVTDPFGQSAETTFTVEDLADPEQPEPAKKSSGFLSMGWLQISLGVMLVLLRRRQWLAKQ